MHPMLRQAPLPGTRLRACVGDVLTLVLDDTHRRPGTGYVRTNLGCARIRRDEIVRSTRRHRPVLERDWHDRPMQRRADGRFELRLPLLEPGLFAAKCCFVPEGRRAPLWPEGADLAIKVTPAAACAANSIYSAFVRQFGPALTQEEASSPPDCVADLDRRGYVVIPPSGTFRNLAARLDVLFDTLRFRILQLLPIHPAPTTYARMGRYGSPFAALDFLAVDPALAEFDPGATPLDQFRELLDAVHAHGAMLFMDLPANHTGWASTLATHHPEWFRREPDGRFRSPGAWGVVWEDLIELDYRHVGLRDFMAEVFLFWCRQGVDGFRCDAGYMIPLETWEYLVAKVRTQFPDTIFLLEGLGGKLSVTRSLLDRANLDWAYSELFQTEDRAAFEHYLPGAQRLSAEVGPLVHFAETHDNPRLAARSTAYARMRTALAALASENGAFGMANGVEWFARERIDVHGAGGLRWGSEPNQCDWIRRLNTLLATHPAFFDAVEPRMIQVGPGNSLALLRQPADAARSLLVLVNLDAAASQPVAWPAEQFDPDGGIELLAAEGPESHTDHGLRRVDLAPGAVHCLSRCRADAAALDAALREPAPRRPARVRQQELRAAALRIRAAVTGDAALPPDAPVEALAEALAADPERYVESLVGPERLPPVTHWLWPRDRRRIVPLPPSHLLLVQAAAAFRVRIDSESGQTLAVQRSIDLAPDRHVAVIDPLHDGPRTARLTLHLAVFEPGGTQRASACLRRLADGPFPEVPLASSGAAVRRGGHTALLTNGCGAMTHLPARWGELLSRYDALLAANPDPAVPCDRQVLWTRCRLWIRHRGYSRAVDSACLDHFACEPGAGRAVWHFRVPVGHGRWIPLDLHLSLEQGANRLTLTLDRRPPPADEEGALAAEETVRVILRPDLESRSFHELTKAYTGLETEFPNACTAAERAVRFLPRDRPGLLLHSPRAEYVQQPEWAYAVERAQDRERGMDAHSDLFSPGYFQALLRGGERLDLVGELAATPESAAAGATPGTPLRALPDRLPWTRALARALDDFVVRRDRLRTVIAGYPWFLDWGRDTLIVLRGMIAAGQTEASLAILREFGRFERDGTLPNMIRGNDDSNRDTSDAPLWYGVAVGDLLRVLGPDAVLDADCVGRTVRDVVESIARGYRDGTPNGLRMDPESGLIFSPSHFTWMDTNHPAGSPREGYPIEIQALWVATLDLLAGQTPGPAADEWKGLAERARAGILRHFWRETGGFLSDCLHAPAGTTAAAARPDDHLRSNQLLAITLGAVRDHDVSRRILRACEELLVPGGIRTLSDRPTRHPLPILHQGRALNNPLAPYWGRYEGDEDTRRKPAYHNGTAWTWPFPHYPEALLAVYGDSARDTARALLLSAAEALGEGVPGHLPEILDGDTPHTPRGCDAQAWGVSELLRVSLLVDPDAT